MSTRRRVIVCPLSGAAGRRVGIEGQMSGAAFSVHALTVFAPNVGLTGRDVLDVVEPGRIEWAAGEPEVWRL
ncbi:hypothetical protein ACIF85_42310 [Streptomyces sp. NPDC086033]|uniref:hypothetical protein n=1 Tax=Streptomyces sp. NPDC086033 TaxID=3365747 RepID=UPI0037CE25E3